MTHESYFIRREGQWLAWADPDEPMFWTDRLGDIANGNVDGDVLMLTDRSLAQQQAERLGGEVVSLGQLAEEATR